jgi:DNA-binding ferritin-like protein (Dps family)
LENYFGPAASYVKRASALLENYSTWISGIYDNYIVCTFRWTYRHVDIQNEALFDRCIALLEECESEITKLAGDKAEYFIKHLAAAKVTFYQMKMNKVIHHTYQNIAKSGITRFSGCEDIPPVRKQSFFNVEMQHGVKVPVIIPDHVKKQVDELDVYSISDQLDLENTQNIGRIVRAKLGKTNNKQEDVETVI